MTDGEGKEKERKARFEMRRFPWRKTEYPACGKSGQLLRRLNFRRTAGVKKRKWGREESRETHVFFPRTFYPAGIIISHGFALQKHWEAQCRNGELTPLLKARVFALCLLTSISPLIIRPAPNSLPGKSSRALPGVSRKKISKKGNPCKVSEEAPPPGNLREIGGDVEYYLKIRAGTFCSACDGKIATVFLFFFSISAF